MTKSASGSATRGILEGVRVLDLTSGLAGPVATMFLAEAGADVVKVETSEGDSLRGTAAFATWNRGKRSVVLDLDVPEDLQLLERLLGESDVLVHSLDRRDADRLASRPALGEPASPGGDRLHDHRLPAGASRRGPAGQRHPGPGALRADGRGRLATAAGAHFRPRTAPQLGCRVPRLLGNPRQAARAGEARSRRSRRHEPAPGRAVFPQLGVEARDKAVRGARGEARARQPAAPVDVRVRGRALDPTVRDVRRVSAVRRGDGHARSRAAGDRGRTDRRGPRRVPRGVRNPNRRRVAAGSVGERRGLRDHAARRRRLHDGRRTGSGRDRRTARSRRSAAYVRRPCRSSPILRRDRRRRRLRQTCTARRSVATGGERTDRRGHRSGRTTRTRRCTRSPVCACSTSECGSRLRCAPRCSATWAPTS